jgi:DNA-binding NarL/FixJ family response regulator
VAVASPERGIAGVASNPPTKPVRWWQAAEMSQTGRPIRLLVLDDHEMVLQGLVAMLGPYEGDVEVVATATSPEEAGRLSEALRPDVALVDVRMRSKAGFEFCGELLRLVPEMKVVMLTVYDDEQYVFRALEAGASGYLTKQVTAEQLVEQLRRVMSGEVVVDSSLAGRLALSASRRARGDFWPGANLGLSRRESEVLSLLVQGASNRAIADRLMVGDETVKTHVSSILRKLEVADRTQAVAVALRERIFL